uniref:Uncharacterized protein n=1 Tax=viral metagenome TaxID=1070528 RepID=A0A6M3KXW4_9ZZZZ
MGTINFGAMKEYAKFQLGNNTEFEAVGSSATNFYGLWVNRAYNHLTTRDRFFGVRRDFYFPQLETSSTANTVDGTAYVSVPTDCLIIREVYDTTNNRKLVNVPHSEYVGYTSRTDTTAEGQPTSWVRQGTYIYLYPTPDATYALRIYHRKIPVVLSVDGAVTEIGDEWDDIIVQLAVYYGKFWTGDYEGAKMAREDVNDRIASLISIYGKEKRAMSKYFHLDEAYKDYGY